MNCEEALGKINRYMNDTLSLRELEAFMEHMEECPECMEELEIQYTISAGIRYLEEGSNDSFDVPQLFRQDWMEHMKWIRHKRLQGDILFYLCVFLSISILVFLLLVFGVVELPVLVG